VDSTDPPGPQEDYYAEAVTGYASQHVGETIQLTTANPGEAPQPGWFYPIALTGSSGSSDFRDSIINCWEPGGDNELGDEVDKEPGNIVGPTRQGFRDIFNDPDEQNQRWDDDLNWPVHADGSPVSVSSRRIRPIPMFDPRTWPDIDQGRKPVEVMNLAGIWMEDFDGNNVVTARWLHYTAVKENGTVPAELY
jgi:hypothetical protein